MSRLKRLRMGALSLCLLGCTQSSLAQLITRDDLPLKPRILQVSIHVADMERAAMFYSTVLGMQLKGKYSPAPNLEERFYGFEDRMGTNVALASTVTAKPNPTPSANPMEAPMSFNLVVPDVKAVCAKVVSAGGKIVSDPITRKAGPFMQDMAFVQDPDGTLIELVHFY